MRKSKLNLISIISIFVFALAVFCTVSNASTEYYTGEKSDHTRKEHYLTGVTEEMCKSDYWKDKTFLNLNEVLMNFETISTINQKTVDASGTMVFDLETFNPTFNANNRKESLASEAIPTRDLYINGEKIDNQAYFSNMQNAIKETGYTEAEEPIKYGICTNRADLKSWPTDDVVGYNPTDPDDELQSSAMNLNEPFIIQAKCVIGENTYYWGYSNNCTGWVNAKNVAICESKEDWTNYWKVDITGNNFVTVTGSRIVLKSDSSEENVSIMIGTILKLVPENEIPEDLIGNLENNYLVYFAGNDENGIATKKYALLSKDLELNQGFLELTQNNVLDVAFSCVGDEYGWGGMSGNMDCSLYTRSIYRCFGFELPRNTTWQQKVPDVFKDISDMDDEEKTKFIATLPAGALLYFPGHTMVYIGMDKNKNFVVSDLGSVADEPEGSTVETVYAVTVNSLDVKRANGTTWLRNLNGVVSFASPVDISKATIELEEEKFTYDGEEKKPNVIVKYNDKLIYEGVHYELEYSNNIDVGTATINITGINNFTNSVVKNFEITEIKEPEEDKDDENGEGEDDENKDNPVKDSEEEQNPSQSQDPSQDQNENENENESQNQTQNPTQDQSQNSTQNQNQSQNQNQNSSQNEDGKNKQENQSQNNNLNQNSNNSNAKENKDETTVQNKILPKTGDYVAICIALLIISLIVFIVTSILIKKNSKKEK